MKKLLFVFMLFMGVNPALYAQLLESELEVLYFKRDQNSTFEAQLSDEDGVRLEGQELKLFLVTDSTNTELDSKMTDENGSCVFPIENISSLMNPVTHSGHFMVAFMGNEEVDEGSNDISIKDAELIVKAEVIDSVNYLTFQLNSWDEEGELVGVEDGEIYFYIPRLFGLLQVGEAWTDGDGYDQAKFPMDIPGDENGELSVVTRIDEHEEFGTLEVSGKVTWGIPLIIDETESRALWSSRPPLWMVITFAILMMVVWIHYGIIFFKLKQINRTGKDKDEIVFDM